MSHECRRRRRCKSAASPLRSDVSDGHKTAIRKSNHGRHKGDLKLQIRVALINNCKVGETAERKKCLFGTTNRGHNYEHMVDSHHDKCDQFYSHVIQNSSFYLNKLNNHPSLNYVTFKRISKGSLELLINCKHLAFFDQLERSYRSDSLTHCLNEIFVTDNELDSIGVYQLELEVTINEEALDICRDLLICSDILDNTQEAMPFLSRIECACKLDDIQQELIEKTKQIKQTYSVIQTQLSNFFTVLKLTKPLEIETFSSMKEVLTCKQNIDTSPSVGKSIQADLIQSFVEIVQTVGKVGKNVYIQVKKLEFHLLKYLKKTQVKPFKLAVQDLDVLMLPDLSFSVLNISVDAHLSVMDKQLFQHLVKYVPSLFTALEYIEKQLKNMKDLLVHKKVEQDKIMSNNITLCDQNDSSTTSVTDEKNSQIQTQAYSEVPNDKASNKSSCDNEKNQNNPNVGIQSTVLQNQCQTNDMHTLSTVFEDVKESKDTWIVQEDFTHQHKAQLSVSYKSRDSQDSADRVKCSTNRRYSHAKSSNVNTEAKEISSSIQEYPNSTLSMVNCDDKETLSTIITDTKDTSSKTNRNTMVTSNTAGIESPFKKGDATNRKSLFSKFWIQSTSTAGNCKDIKYYKLPNNFASGEVLSVHANSSNPKIMLNKDLQMVENLQVSNENIKVNEKKQVTWGASTVAADGTGNNHLTVPVIKHNFAYGQKRRISPFNFNKNKKETLKLPVKLTATSYNYKPSKRDLVHIDETQPTKNMDEPSKNNLDRKQMDTRTKSPTVSPFHIHCRYSQGNAPMKIKPLLPDQESVKTTEFTFDDATIIRRVTKSARGRDIVPSNLNGGKFYGNHQRHESPNILSVTQLSSIYRPNTALY